MIVEFEGVRFYIDNKLARDLDNYIDDMARDEEDLVVLLCGKEGAGKSLFSRQLAWYVYYRLSEKYGKGVKPTFESIHFNLREYMNKSLKGVKFQVNIMDESRRVLNRKRSTSRDAVDFTDYLSETRDAQQIHLILLPAYHDIEKYILMWRAKLVIKLEKYRDDKSGRLVKGEAKVLPIDSRLIYTWDENRYRYPSFNPKKYGGYQFEFKPVECFKDIDLYKEKKAKFRLQKYGDDSEDKERSFDEKMKIKALETLDKKSVLDLYDISDMTYYRWKKSLLNNNSSSKHSNLTI